MLQIAPDGVLCNQERNFHAAPQGSREVRARPIYEALVQVAGVLMRQHAGREAIILRPV
jgi:hypothetical protein